MRLSRKGVNGTLYVDDSRVDSGRAKGTPSFVNALQWLHIGGVPEGYNNKRVPVSEDLMMLSGEAREGKQRLISLRLEVKLQGKEGILLWVK